MATSSISQFICIITMFTWNTKWQFHLLIRKKVWWAFLLHCSATSPSPPFSSTERCFSPEASHSVLLGLSFYIQTRYRADQRQATKSGSRENNGNAGVLELESEAVSPGPNPCCVPSSYCAKEVNGWRPRKKQETEGRRSYSPSRLRLLRSQCIPHWGVPSRLRLPRSQCIPHGGGGVPSRLWLLRSQCIPHAYTMGPQKSCCVLLWNWRKQFIFGYLQTNRLKNSWPTSLIPLTIWASQSCFKVILKQPLSFQIIPHPVECWNPDHWREKDIYIVGSGCYLWGRCTTKKDIPFQVKVYTRIPWNLLFFIIPVSTVIHQYSKRPESPRGYKNLTFVLRISHTFVISQRPVSNWVD